MSAENSRAADAYAPSHIIKPWKLFVVAFGLVAILSVIGTSPTPWWIPADKADYFITTVAAIIAALNVLFTLWLLRTAQHQLRDAREVARDTIAAMKEQEESLRGQLDQAARTHEAERAEATKALKIAQETADEALRARVDQLGPRVSFVVREFSLWYFRRNSETDFPDWREIRNSGDIHIAESDNVFAVEIRLVWALKNWGEEPTTVYFPSPLHENQSDPLAPHEERAVKHYIRIPGPSIREFIQDGGAVFSLSDNPIQVQVSDLGSQVYDNLAWHGNIRPFAITNGEIVFDKQWTEKVPQYGLRQRHYNFLELRDLANAENEAQ